MASAQRNINDIYDKEEGNNDTIYRIIIIIPLIIYLCIGPIIVGSKKIWGKNKNEINDDYKKMTEDLKISATLKEEDFKDNDYLIVEAVNDYCGGEIESLEKDVQFLKAKARSTTNKKKEDVKDDTD